jgi:hypothetical protein
MCGVTMKPFEFFHSDKELIRIFPIDRGTLVVEHLEPFFMQYATLKGASKNIACSKYDIYRPGECPICDFLFEDLYLEEYNDAVLWI